MRLVAVIGGGPAGMSAALALSERARVLLLERAPLLGGKVSELACKGNLECLDCGVCAGVKLIDRVKREKNIEVITNCEIEKIEYNDNKARLHIKHANGQPIEYIVEGLIVATGYEHRELHDESERLLTGAKLEREFRLGIAREFAKGEKIAFVQCYGSRDRSAHHCSKVCCKYASRFAKRALECGALPTIFYMDVRDEQMRELRQKARFVRAKPCEFVQEKDHVLVRYASENEEPREEVYDRVILSTGIVPSSNQALGDMLALRFTDGFADRSLARVPSTTAGTLRAPMDILEAINSGAASAGELLRKMSE